MVKQRVRAKRVGENHHNAKYTDGTVEIVRRLHDQGLGYRRISKKMEMPLRTVRSFLDYSRR